MTSITFTLTHYDVNEPWIALSRDRLSVELPDGEEFAAWARSRFPGREYVAEADFGSLPAWCPGVS